jgi:glycolate oxidase FAD binding subunit
MSVVSDSLPLTATDTPQDQAALSARVAELSAAGTPIYPIGGGTSLDFGLPATQPGQGISLANLTRVVDYPARDMTITVEAGLTAAALANILVAERQWLPIDVPYAESATLGGLVTTNHSGPRRYGYGTLRDYVIGISAVDGRGTPFKAGGRVVKNVAGYDFCKLLTGSLGTLAIITQLTLKIRPIPHASAFLVCEVRELDTAERLLAGIVTSGTTPAAVELLLGPKWREHASLGVLTPGAVGWLAVGVEGSTAEVEWMLERLASEWRALGVDVARPILEQPAEQLWRDLTLFSAEPGAALVFKAAVVPSRTTQMIAALQTADANVSIQAHAGNGIVIGRFETFDVGDISRVLIGRLQPAAQTAGGSGIVLSSTLSGLTRQATWGNVTAATPWMSKVKQQFDPRNLLNPGRFAYDSL